jgi:hypothetical protein
MLLQSERFLEMFSKIYPDTKFHYCVLLFRASLTPTSETRILLVLLLVVN